MKLQNQRPKKMVRKRVNLTENEIRAIRSSKNRIPQRILAEQYNVSRPFISMIQHQKKYTWIK